MIEVVYKDEKQHAKGNEGIFQLPRNVRQIGTTDQNYRVYMEDYVYTFLGRAAASGENKEEKERHLAVFMGETKWDAGTCYLFIRGAVLVSGGEISQEHIEFTDVMWQQIHEDRSITRLHCEISAKNILKEKKLSDGFLGAGCSRWK